MTFTECEIRNKAIIENMRLWATGKAKNPIERTDVDLAGATYNISIPKAFCHFVSSDNPDTCCATGEFKTILNTLKKLQNAIIER